MYVTGGFGPSASNEGFTSDYDLPNATAYAETCASVAFIFWAQRMLNLDLDGRYADLLERALYNGALSGLSRDGENYFYENKLESDGTARRWAWHPCPCCTMNVSRLVASIGGYFYSTGPSLVAVHLYGGNAAELEVDGKPVRITEESRYPWSGKIRITVEPEAQQRFSLRLRIPAWAEGATASVGGEPVDVAKGTTDGYLDLTREWSPGDTVELDLPMPPGAPLRQPQGPRGPRQGRAPPRPARLLPGADRQRRDARPAALAAARRRDRGRGARPLRRHRRDDRPRHRAEGRLGPRPLPRHAAEGRARDPDRHPLLPLGQPRAGTDGRLAARGLRPMPHVVLEHLHKQFGAVEVIRDLSLAVEAGEFCALLGPSGCGKSTLLRMIAGLETVTSGRVIIADRDVTGVPPAKRRIAMVFQSYALYPHMTVRQNIGFSLDVAGTAKREIAEKADKVAALLQLDALMDRKPAQLSGGQRQRVAIGRALVRDPEVFLFDEPLSNLDAKLRVQMRLELAKLHQELATTMIYVTHDQVEAMTLADRVVVLDRGEIAQVGTPLDLYHRPENRFVASFIGSPAMNFLPAAVVSAEGREAMVAPTGGTPVAAALRAPATATAGLELGIRPEHVAPVAAGTPGSALDGRIGMVERLGHTTMLYVDTPAGSVVVEDDGGSAARTGEPVGLAFAPGRVHLFDGDGRAL